MPAKARWTPTQTFVRDSFGWQLVSEHDALRWPWRRWYRRRWLARRGYDVEAMRVTAIESDAMARARKDAVVAGALNITARQVESARAAFERLDEQRIDEHVWKLDLDLALKAGIDLVSALEAALPDAE